MWSNSTVDMMSADEFKSVGSNLEGRSDFVVRDGFVPSVMSSTSPLSPKHLGSYVSNGLDHGRAGQSRGGAYMPHQYIDRMGSNGDEHTE